MQFNMLEVMTNQFSSDDKEVFGKLLLVLRCGVKRFIESHAKSPVHSLKILIISDLSRGHYQDSLFQSAVKTPTQVDFFNTMKNLNGLPLLQKYITDMAGPYYGGAKWIDLFNPPTNDDDENFDLHAFYALMSEVELTGGIKMKWEIDRTVYSDLTPSGQIIVENALGMTRDSISWDSNTNIPVQLIGKYDLVLLRRGLCYCGYIKDNGFPMACCGAAHKDGSDITFLTKIGQLLKVNDQSAAYLGGWNPLVEDMGIEYWENAIKAIKVQSNTLTAQIVPASFDAIFMSGIYISHGRLFSSNNMISP